MVAEPGPGDELVVESRSAERGRELAQTHPRLVSAAISTEQAIERRRENARVELVLDLRVGHGLEQAGKPEQAHDVKRRKIRALEQELHTLDVAVRCSPQDRSWVAGPRRRLSEPGEGFVQIGRGHVLGPGGESRPGFCAKRDAGEDIDIGRRLGGWRRCGGDFSSPVLSRP